MEHPRALDGDVKCGQRNSGGSCERYGAGLDLATRTARAVDAEGYGPAFFQCASKAEESAHGVAAAGTFDGDESKFVDDASHIFAVIAVAAHHADATVSKQVRGRDDASMPKREDERPLSDRVLRAFFVGDADAQGGADEANEGVASRDDDAQEDSLADSEAAGSAGIDGGRFGNGGFRHGLIVMGGGTLLSELPQGVEVMGWRF